MEYRLDQVKYISTTCMGPTKLNSTIVCRYSSFTFYCFMSLNGNSYIKYLLMYSPVFNQSPVCPYIPLNALFLSLTNKFDCFQYFNYSFVNTSLFLYILCACTMHCSVTILLSISHDIYITVC